MYLWWPEMLRQFLEVAVEINTTVRSRSFGDIYRFLSDPSTSLYSVADWIKYRKVSSQTFLGATVVFNSYVL